MPLDKLDKMDYEIGVLTILKLIVENKITIDALEGVLHDRTEKFIKTYGIQTYDKLEAMLE